MFSIIIYDNNMNINNIIEQTGLNQKESVIYLATLELGIATASQITQKTGIHRTYFYDIIKGLVKKGFIKQSKKDKKTIFIAESPNKILEMQERKLNEFKKIIPELNAINNLTTKKPKVYYYNGQAGMEEINNDTIMGNESELVGFTTPRFINSHEKKLSNEYIAKRKSAGKMVRVIGEMSNEIMEVKKRDDQELRETRILPVDLFHSEIEIIIGNDKVYIVNYKDEFGMIIEDKEIAKVQKQIFEIIWNGGKIIR